MHKLRQLICAMLVLALTAVLCACGKKIPQDDADPMWADIQQNGVLRVGVYTGYGALCRRTSASAAQSSQSGESTDSSASAESDGGEYEGYDIDLMRQIAQRLGLKLQFVDVSASGASAQELMNAKTIDCAIGGIEYTAGLERIFLLTEPYLTDCGVFVLSESSGAKNLADLNGLRLAQVRYSTLEAELAQSPLLSSAFSERISVETEASALEAVATDRADVAFVMQTDAANAIAEGGAFRILQSDTGEVETLGVCSYVIELPLGSSTLKKRMDEAYATMQRDKIVTQLQQKWFGTDYVPAVSSK